MANTIGRNDSCHCGSGSKYKNCCLKKDNTSVKSKVGVGVLIVFVLLGIWFLGAALSAEESVIECPTGQSWSQAHQHCH